MVGKEAVDGVAFLFFQIYLEWQTDFHYLSTFVQDNE